MRITAFYSQLGEISVLVHSKLEFHSLSRLGHMTELRETKRRYRRAYAAALQAGLEVKRVRPLQRKGDISKKTMFEFFHNCVAVIRAVGAGPKRGAGGECPLKNRLLLLAKPMCTAACTKRFCRCSAHH